MKDTFIFLEKGSFGVWLEPKNPAVVHNGRLTDLPVGAEPIAISPTQEGSALAVRYFTAINTNVRAATA